jgi:hypothetical protein
LIYHIGSPFRETSHVGMAGSSVLLPMSQWFFAGTAKPFALAALECVDEGIGWRGKGAKAFP